MSLPLMSAALRQRGLTYSERVVLAYLADRANAEDICWPSVETIMQDIEASRRAVLKAFERLKELRLISIAGRYKQSSVYRLHPENFSTHPQPLNGAEIAPETSPFPWDRPDCGANPAPEPLGAKSAPDPEVQKTPFSGAKNDRSEVQNLHPEHNIESNIDSPITILPTVPARTGIGVGVRACEAAARRADPAIVLTLRRTAERNPDGWDDWWAAYPLKDGIGAARIAYVQALNEATATELLAGLQRYAFRPEPRMRPMPAKWLREKRWLSEVTAATMTPAVPAFDPSKLTGAGALLYKLRQERAAREADGPDSPPFAPALELNHG